MLWISVCAVWIGLIFLLSSHNGTQSHGLSTSVARIIAKAMYPDFGAWSMTEQTEWIDGMDSLIRKMAHFAEYCALGMFAFPAARALLSSPRRKQPLSAFRCGMIAFYPCMAAAAADEFIQISSAGRVSTAADVILDCAGVVIGIIVMGLLLSGGEASGGNAAAARRKKHRNA